jgi:hypothetical protein
MEQMMLAALALHPKDRPASVAAWRKTLGGEVPAAPARPDATWGQALRANWWLLLLAVAMVAAAVMVTFRWWLPW